MSSKSACDVKIFDSKSIRVLAWNNCKTISEQNRGLALVAGMSDLNWESVYGTIISLQPKNAHKLMAPPPNHLIYTGKEGYKPLCHQADNHYFIKTEMSVKLLEVSDQLKINKISSNLF